MASSINASTSGAGGVITTADNTGTLQLQSGGTTIATISSTGLSTQVGSPAFSAYQSSLQTISTGTATKVQFQTEEFDTNSNFDSTTNYRFTPTIAGYYLITAGVYYNTSITSGEVWSMLYKNGSSFRYLGDFNATTGPGQLYEMNGSCLVYANGTSDYFEIYTRQDSGSSKVLYANTTQPGVYFSAFLARSA